MRAAKTSRLDRVPTRFDAKNTTLLLQLVTVKCIWSHLPGESRVSISRLSSNFASGRRRVRVLMSARPYHFIRLISSLEKLVEIGSL